MYNQTTVEDLKASFHSIYANLPAALRDDIILVVDEQPYTWNAVNVEVEIGTELGERMLKQLKGLEII